MDCLQADTVTENIEKQFSKFPRIWRQYRRGVLSSSDCRERIQNVIWDGYFKYIQEFFTFNLTQCLWDDFLEEYRKAEKGIPLVDSDGESWLCLRQWDNVRKMWIPASVSDRTQVLRLMRAFHIPPEYYTPLPVGTPKPNMQAHPSGLGNSPATISFECEDDGGLLSCAAPCGRTFTLKNNLGLEAVIIIKEVFSEPKEVFHNRAVASYRGEGYVEGYTEMSFQREDPKLYIGLDEGKVYRLIAFLSTTDGRAYRQYPMWQDYFCHYSTIDDIFEKVLDSLFDSFCSFKGNIPIS